MPLISWVLMSTFGLKGAAKALVQDGEPQRLLDFHPCERLALHAGVKEGRCALAVVLDPIHRNIGVLAQYLIAAAMLGIDAHANRGGSKDLGSVDEERRPQSLQHELDIFRDLVLALDGIEQQQEFVAADPRQHVGFAQVQPKPLRDFDQQGIPDRMAVIVVDVLEIVDVEKGEREFVRCLAALQEPVGTMFDHAPRRQIGQFVIIGRTEQLVLKGLLLADVSVARKQQRAVGDTNRTVGGEKDLFGRPAGEAFFCDGGAPGAEQFDAGLAALVQFPREPGRRNLKLCRRGIVHQQEVALLVLNRNAGREHPEYISQNAESGISSEFGLVWCGILHGVACAVLHDRRNLPRSLVVLVKWNPKKRRQRCERAV